VKSLAIFLPALKLLLNQAILTSVDLAILEIDNYFLL